MAKHTMKVKGKEIGPAEVYAEPHTMSGQKLNYEVPNESGPECVRKMNVSVGNISRGLFSESTGKVKTRGTGAATKGLYSSTKLG
jgi:hypothetical protein